MRWIVATVHVNKNELRFGGIDGLLDMFRYCGAYPYQQADASIISRALVSPPGAAGDLDATVSFNVSTSTDIRGGDIKDVGISAFTPKRWKSFGFTLDNYREI